MTPERWQQIRQVYEQATALPDNDRQQFLERACDGDADLCAEVESLLDYEDRAGCRFMNDPAVDLGAAVPSGSRLGRRIGVYQILKEIGHGGMGEVYRAARVDGQYEKQVAIKLVRTGYDSSLILERFRHERQILAGLDHPNIARLLDGGTTEEGIPYLVMELVEGVPIDEYCEKHDLAIADRLQLFLQVCSAVQYAHQRLVIHRDLKPSNILVTADGVPKLLDFGIAKLVNPASGEETTLLAPMTPEYASPEQMRGEPITTSSDVYSLGVVLYRLLTHRSPYGAETKSATGIARAINEDEPERPSAAVLRDAERNLRSSKLLKGDLDTIVLKALRKEPQYRYSSVEHLADDIRNHLRNLPINAARGSWRYRAGKFVRRHKAAIAAVAAVTVTVVAGVTVTVREAHIARQQAAVAREQRSRAEKRFNDLRRLANSLMFEIHDSIEGLPGTTSARRLIVQRSREYLDSLAQESGGDVSLQRELASAYERLGKVQGDMYGSSLGDAQAAVQSLRKAVAIREAVVAANRGNAEDLIALTRAYHETARVQWYALGGTKEGLQNLQLAVTTGESAVRLQPENVNAIEALARVYQYLGDIQGGSGLRGGTADLRQGLENHRKALPLLQRVADAAPLDPEKRYLLARASIALGDDYVRSGDPEQAFKSYQHAEEILKRVAEQYDNTVYRRGYAVCHTRMGDALLMMGRAPEALMHYRRERQILEPLATADPHDMVVQSTFVTSEGDIGHAMVEAGQVQQGIATLERALDNTTAHAKALGDSYSRALLASTAALLGEALERGGNGRKALKYYDEAFQLYVATAAADVADTEDAVNAAIMRNHLGDASLTLGEVPQALQDYRDALGREDALAATGPDNVELLYARADTYAGMGNAMAALAGRAADQKERARVCTDARQWYKKSLDSWHHIPNPGPVSPNLFRETSRVDVAHQLSECERVVATQVSSPPEQ